LRDVFDKYFNAKLKDINDNMGSKYDIDEEKKLLELMCTYSLFRKLYPEEEFKGFWKELWFMQKKIPVLEAHSFVFVYVCIFLSKVCPLDKRPGSLDPKNEKQFILQYVEALEPVISIEIVSQYTRFCVWLSRMESVATSNAVLKNVDKRKTGLTAVQETVDSRIALVCEGFNIIMRLYKLLYLCFMIHINEEKPISKNLLGKLVLAI
jgi:WASH complex subunit 7